MPRIKPIGLYNKFCLMARWANSGQDAPPTRKHNIFDKQKKIRKIKTRGQMELGIKHYQEKKFTEAVRLFREIINFDPGDKAAHIYLESSQFYLDKHPDDQWDGTLIMDHK